MKFEYPYGRTAVVELSNGGEEKVYNVTEVCVESDYIVFMDDKRNIFTYASGFWSAFSTENP